MPIIINDKENPSAGDFNGLNLIQIVKTLAYQMRLVTGKGSWLQAPTASLQTINAQFQEVRFMTLNSINRQVIANRYADSTGEIVGEKIFTEMDSFTTDFTVFTPSKQLVIEVIVSTSDNDIADFELAMVAACNEDLTLGRFQVEGDRSVRKVFRLWHRSNTDYSPVCERENGTPFNVASWLTEEDELGIKLLAKVNQTQAVARIEHFLAVVEG